MAILGVITDLGLSTAQDAANDEGFNLVPVSFGVSDVAGALDPVRTTKNAGLFFSAAISSRVIIDQNTIKFLLTIPPNQIPAGTFKIIREIYLDINDSVSAPFLFAIGQPTTEIRYNADDQVTLELEMAITNLDLTANFIFEFTQATEINDHNLDPAAHTEIITALKKAGIYLTAGAFPIERRGQFVEDEKGAGVEFDGTKATITHAGVIFTATFNGTELNTKQLTFDGVLTTDEVRAVFNAANYPNTVEHDDGTGTQVLAAATPALLGGTYVVEENDIVYKDTDGIYKQALADGTIKSKMAGIAYLTDKCVSAGMYHDLNSAEAIGTSLFLSATDAGKLVTFDTNINVGFSLGAFILYSGYAGDVTADVTQSFDAIVTDGTGLGKYTETQLAIAAVPNPARILVDKLEDIKTIIDTQGKVIDFVFNGIDTGWKKFSGSAAAFLVAFDSVPDNGTWRFEWNGQESGNLAFNADATAVQTEFNLFSGHTGVTVTGDYTAGFTVSFDDEVPQPLPTFNFAGQNEIQRYNFSNIPDDGTIAFTYEGDTTVNFPWDDNAADLQIAVQALIAGNPAYPAAANLKVTTTGSFTAGYFQVEFDGDVLESGNRPISDMFVTAKDLDMSGAETLVNGLATGALPIAPVVIQEGRFSASNLRSNTTDIVMTVSQLTAGEDVGPDTAIRLDASDVRLLGYGLIKDFEIGVDVNQQDFSVVEMRFDNVTIPVLTIDERPGLDSDFSRILGYGKDLVAQLKLTEHPSNKKRVKISAADIQLPSGITLSQQLNEFKLLFKGGEVEFTTGNIYASDGISVISTFTPIIPSAAQTRWASITITAGAVTADKQVNGLVTVTFAQNDGASPALAEKAEYATGGKAVGQVPLLGDTDLAEISRFICSRDDNSDLNGEYVILYDDVGSVAIWWDIDNNGTTEPLHGAARSIKIIDVVENADPNTVAISFHAAVNGDSKFSAVRTTNRVLVTDASTGPRFNANAGTTLFFVTTEQNGKDVDPSGLADINCVEFLQIGLGGAQPESAGGSGNSIIEGLELGQTLGAITEPKAVYPKIKRFLTIDTTTNRIHFNEGGGSVFIQLTSGVYRWPYTALQAEIKSLLDAASPNGYTYTAVLNEFNMKISSTGTFNLENSTLLSALPKLGFGAVDLSDDLTFYRAASVHTFTQKTQLFLTDTSVAETAQGFSGFITVGGNQGDTLDLVRAGELVGFPSLVSGSEYFTNGSTGEINTAQALENSVRVGSADIGNVLVLDFLSYFPEPDTDFDANTDDGIVAWKNKPEWPYFQESDVQLYAADAQGDRIVTIQDNVGGTDVFCSYSIDGGKSFKKVEGLSIVATNWTIANYFDSPMDVLIDGDYVFIVAPAFFDGTYNKYRGWYGQFESDGTLTMFTANQFKGGNYDKYLTDHSSAQTARDGKLAKRNGILYFTWKDIGSKGLFIVQSSDNGLSWSDKTACKSNASAVYSYPDNGQKIFTDDVPNATITAGENVTNGDFATGDLTGWIDASFGTGTVNVNADNQVEIGKISSGNSGSLRQVLTLATSKSYLLTIDVINKDGDMYLEGDSLFVDVYDNSGFTGSRDIFSNFPLKKGKLQFVFKSSTGVGGLVLGYNSSAGTPNATITLDNISIQEILPNRVSILHYSDNSNPAPVPSSAHQTALSYTDEFLMTTAWSLGLDFGEITGLDLWNLHIGSCELNDSGLRAFQVINGHASGYVTGQGVVHALGGADVNAIDTHLRIIDFGQTVPTEVNYSFQRLKEISATDGAGSYARLGSWQGDVALNSLGAHYTHHKDNLILKITETSVLMVQRASQISSHNDAAFLVYISDINDVVNTTHFLGFHNNVQSNEWANESIIGKTDSQTFLVEKIIVDDLDAATEGRVQSREITLNDGANPELITNGDFATDTEGVDWIEESAGALTISGGKANMAFSGNVGFHQAITTEIGTYYTIAYNVDDVSVIAGNFMRVTARAILDVAVDGLNPLPISAKAQNANENGTTQKLSFRATSTTTKINLSVEGNASGTAIVDNVSVKKSAIQISNATDVMNKPNIDDYGRAGILQMVSQPDAVHLLGLRDRDNGNANDHDGYYSLAYNKYGLQKINTGVVPQTSPTEVADKITGSMWDGLSGVAFDENNPEFGVAAYIVGTGGSYEVFTTTNGGEKWTKQVHNIATFAASGIAQTNQYRLKPHILIKDKKVCILFATGTNNTSRNVYGVFGTMTDAGFLSLALSNAGSVGVINSDAIYNIQTTRGPSGKIYVSARMDTGNVMGIAVSTDDGEFFTDGSGTAGTETTVKNVAANITQVDIDNPIPMFAMPDPDNGANERIVVIISNASAQCIACFTDTADLTSNWDAQYIVSSSGGGYTPILGFGVSPDYKYVQMNGDVTNTNSLYSRLHNFNLTTPVELVNYGDVNSVWGMGGGALDYFNGGFAYNIGGLNYRNNLNRVTWTTNNSFYFSIGTAPVTTYAPKFVKVYDATGNLSVVTSSPWPESSLAYNRVDISLHKTANGRNFFVCQRRDEANKTISGRAELREIIDVTPTTNNIPNFVAVGKGLVTGTENSGDDNFNDLSNKSDIGGTGLTHLNAIVAGDSLITHFLKVNKDGFGSQFINNVKERELNDLVEEFYQVPKIIGLDGNDASIWNFSRSGDNILVVKGTVGSPNLGYHVSTDGGHNFFQIGFTAGGISPNNDYDWNISSPDIIFVGDVAYVSYSKITGNVEIGGTKVDFSNNDSDLVVENLNSGVSIMASGGENFYNPKLLHRNGVFYCFVEASVASITYVVSSDGGATWTSPAKVEDGSLSAQLITQNTLMYADVVDNGSGGNRIVLMKNIQTPNRPYFLYSNDDGATWESTFEIKALTNSYIMGYQTYGNKAAVMIMDTNGNADNITLHICDDLTIAIPVWNETIITDGTDNGSIDVYCGRNTNSTGNFVGHFENIQWRNENELFITWAASESAVIVERNVWVTHVDISNGSDVANAVFTKTKAFTHFNPSPAIDFVNPKFLLAPSGDVYLTTLMENGIATSLSKGRLLARKVVLPLSEMSEATYKVGASNNSITNCIDIGFKQDASAGGFLGHPRVEGATIMFEKENGSAIENLYINDVLEKDDSE